MVETKKDSLGVSPLLTGSRKNKWIEFSSKWALKDLGGGRGEQWMQREIMLASPSLAYNMPCMHLDWIDVIALIKLTWF